MASGLYVGAVGVDAVYLGATEADAVYLGATKIWPTGPSVVRTIVDMTAEFIAFWEGQLYAVSSAAELYRYPQPSGAQVDMGSLNGVPECSTIDPSGYLYFFEPAGSMQTVNNSASPTLSSQGGLNGVSNPTDAVIVSSGDVYVINGDSYGLYWGSTSDGFLTEISGTANANVVVTDGTTIYALSRDGSTMWAIDPSTQAVTSTFSLTTTASSAVAAVVVGGEVWFVGTSGPVYVVDKTNGALIATVTVGSGGGWITASNGRVFVSNKTDGTVSVIDSVSHSVFATINVGASPTQVVAGVDEVYVLNSGDSTGAVSVISSP